MQNKTASYGLAKNFRLTLKRDFEDIFENGKKAACCGLVLWYRLIPQARERARMGITVSKKLGHAPARNRVKRLLREVFRLNRNKLKHGAAFVISPRGRLKDFNSAQDAVLELWRKAGLLETDDTFQ